MVVVQDASTVFNAACAAVATGCAIWVAVRDGRWRKNGLAKRLSDRIDTAQKAADGWHETEHARAMDRDLKRHEREIMKHAGIFPTLATKADVAHVEQTAAAVGVKVDNATSGIDRIEGLLLRKALAT